MKSNAYSLIEVLLASAIAAIGISAAAVVASTIVAQEEINAVTGRAANLQEQAVSLYRLGVTNPADIYELLPEPCSAGQLPAEGEFTLLFSAPTVVSRDVSIPDAVVQISYEATECTLIFPNPPQGEGVVTYRTNTVSVMRPSIRSGP